MQKLIFLLALSTSIFSQKFTNTEIARFENQAKKVEIIRDNWGIPHVYGKTDANAVFGLLYAQCEDDFKRIEMNFIEKLGRTAEIKGESAIYDDLQLRLMIDSAEAVADYNKAAPWLKKLLNAQADGINYFLYKHPKIHPILIKKFKPWYDLLWTDGSIGAISTADLTVSELKDFYSKKLVSQHFKYSNLTFSKPITKNIEPIPEYNQTGSNGFAFSPKITESGNAILYINPHTSFYYRPEVHMISEQGLNSYGAVTWGQMFVYQGFNESCGWMHTSSNVDVADTYAEKIIEKNSKLFYEYDKILKPVMEKKIRIKYLENGVLQTKTFKTFYTNHGPVMAEREGKWVSLKSYNRAMTSLEQSWIRTKSKSFADYKKAMEIKANTSNNTVYADNQGNIAYWHGNFVPIRDKKLNWSKLMDGSISSTNWQGLHKVSETVHIYNPENGWLQNCNSTPFTAAGKYSPKQADYPAYMAPDGENFRGVNAVRVLAADKKFTIDKVIKAGYDNYLSAFEVLVPALIKSFEQNVKPNDSLYIALNEPISILEKWDYRSTESSIASTLAIEWAYKLNNAIQRIYIDEGDGDQVEVTKSFSNSAKFGDLVIPFYKTVQELNQNWGKWQVTWGEMNRFQRVNGDIIQKHYDSKPSLPVGIASSLFGSLPSFNSRHVVGQKSRYGFNGNSFICAVEFGKKIKAQSLLAGGNSGSENSKHFVDQAEMYTKGQFKEVNFYKEDVLKNIERQYRPGE
jgi:acyl-homoserine lactone acylase PvdQ